ncbi:hypothetical protein BZG36_04157 [Bifiguratus adelaidae]|uniref:SAP domain-containing protein n=1 Tax=Bifiguratus adelaidae TaxID=1938954 RepID=A0A261XZP3_9FUNG|nr:hypothetical protein BZG36_04157 [Bifiguratus adelaidae]
MQEPSNATFNPSDFLLDNLDNADLDNVLVGNSSDLMFAFQTAFIRQNSLIGNSGLSIMSSGDGNKDPLFAYNNDTGANADYRLDGKGVPNTMFANYYFGQNSPLKQQQLGQYFPSTNAIPSYVGATDVPPRPQTPEPYIATTNNTPFSPAPDYADSINIPVSDTFDLSSSSNAGMSSAMSQGPTFKTPAVVAPIPSHVSPAAWANSPQRNSSGLSTPMTPPRLRRRSASLSAIPEVTNFSALLSPNFPISNTLLSSQMLGNQGPQPNTGNANKHMRSPPPTSSQMLFSPFRLGDDIDEVDQKDETNTGNTQQQSMFSYPTMENGSPASLPSSSHPLAPLVEQRSTSRDASMRDATNRQMPLPRQRTGPTVSSRPLSMGDFGTFTFTSARDPSQLAYSQQPLQAPQITAIKKSSVSPPHRSGTPPAHPQRRKRSNSLPPHLPDQPIALAQSNGFGRSREAPMPIQIERSARKQPQALAPMSQADHLAQMHEELEKVDFDDVTVAELKEMLKKRGKIATGKKAILAERLMEERDIVRAMKQNDWNTVARLQEKQRQRDVTSTPQDSSIPRETSEPASSRYNATATSTANYHLNIQPQPRPDESTAAPAGMNFGNSSLPQAALLQQSIAQMHLSSPPKSFLQTQPSRSTAGSSSRFTPYSNPSSPRIAPVGSASTMASNGPSTSGSHIHSPIIHDPSGHGRLNDKRWQQNNNKRLNANRLGAAAVASIIPSSQEGPYTTPPNTHLISSGGYSTYSPSAGLIMKGGPSPGINIANYQQSPLASPYSSPLITARDASSANDWYKQQPPKRASPLILPKNGDPSMNSLIDNTTSPLSDWNLDAGPPSQSLGNASSTEGNDTWMTSSFADLATDWPDANAMSEDFLNLPDDSSAFSNADLSSMMFVDKDQALGEDDV